MYDLFFLNHHDPLADHHWTRLHELYPHARRIDGIDGILTAHKFCASQSRTSHFFVIDADNEVLPECDLAMRLPDYDKPYVHIWRARNPLNGLVYGWGGIKLFPKKQFVDRDAMPLDMTMSFSLKLMPMIGSITHFNTSPYNTWRSAFRESTKLACNATPESRQRLDAWCTVAEGAFADWCLRGALEGRAYGLANKTNPEALMKINDWSWLEHRFENLA